MSRLFCAVVLGMAILPVAADGDFTDYRNPESRVKAMHTLLLQVRSDTLGPALKEELEHRLLTFLQKYSRNGVEVFTREEHMASARFLDERSRRIQAQLNRLQLDARLIVQAELHRPAASGPTPGVLGLNLEASLVTPGDRKILWVGYGRFDAPGGDHTALIQRLARQVANTLYLRGYLASGDGP